MRLQLISDLHLETEAVAIEPATGADLLVLAGDTHNAWHSELKTSRGEFVATELATASVSSPGIEQYLQLDTAQAAELSTVLPQLIDELQWCELAHRGYLLLQINSQACLAQWHQLESVHVQAAQWLAPYGRTGTHYFYAESDAIDWLKRDLKLASANTGPRSGEEVYKAACAACHAAGALGAPIFADAGAWSGRIGKGLETLALHAIKGFNAMPPQGGGDISDAEITAAVVYLANAGGAKFEAPAMPAAAASEAAAQ